MTTLAAIRTHRWGEDEERLFAQLAPVFGERLVVVFHNRPAGLALPLPAIDISDATVQAMGLRPVEDWGWRCGDYFLYALRQARPDAAFYWLIEPDVLFTGPVAGFFNRAAPLTQDLLGTRIEPMRPDHRFARGMPQLPLWRAIFALTRASGRALDRLLDLRRAMSAQPSREATFPNDEVFCHSHVAADPDLTAGSLADLLPKWFAGSEMRTDPDILADLLVGRDRAGVWHPVRGRASFRGAVAARMVSVGFLPAMRASLDRLDAADLDAIAAEVGRRARAALAAGRGQAEAAE